MDKSLAFLISENFGWWVIPLFLVCSIWWSVSGYIKNKRRKEEIRIYKEGGAYDPYIEEMSNNIRTLKKIAVFIVWIIVMRIILRMVGI